VLHLIADRVDARWEESGHDPEKFWLTERKFPDGPRTELLREKAYELEEKLTEIGVTLLPPSDAYKED
jgi:hypothetical protein